MDREGIRKEDAVKVLRCILCAIGIMVGGEVCAADQVMLKLQYPEGRIARYKNKYRLDYFSDKAEMILREGSFTMQGYGEWRSLEMVVEGGDSVKVMAKVDKAGSQAILASERLTYEQFPYTLDLLNDLSFVWRIESGGQVGAFDPDFSAFKARRKDMITDLRQVWMPGLAPVLPDRAVSVGDTWEGEQRIEVPFYDFDAGFEPSLVQFASTYKLKKVKEQKGYRVVEIEEDREVHYRIWLHIEVLSLVIDGKGSGNAEWEIDIDRGLVLSHTMKIGLRLPQVRMAGTPNPIDNIEAGIELVFSRKLDKLEKE